MNQEINLSDYSKIIVYFSGGKDSLACLLHLIESGADMSKVELWHHDIDGRESDRLMDWPVTPAYCKAVAEAFSLPIYFSWKMGGFQREMLRENQLTAPTKFETPEGEVVQVGGTRGKQNTRRVFPQVSADLSVRWCSAYLKIDVAATALRNQKRFDHSKTLVLSGERAEESAARAKYLEFEPDRTDNRGQWVTQLKPYEHLPELTFKPSRSGRHVDRWRPIHKWSEADVWAIIERFKVQPHPAYELGWGRVSCLHCIFGSKNQWASSQKVDNDGFETIALYEMEFGKTIHRSKSVLDRAESGEAYPETENPLKVEWAMSKDWRGQIIKDYWQLPAGAYGESCGPT